MSKRIQELEAENRRLRGLITELRSLYFAEIGAVHNPIPLWVRNWPDSVRRQAMSERPSKERLEELRNIRKGTFGFNLLTHPEVAELFAEIKALREERDTAQAKLEEFRKLIGRLRNGDKADPSELTYWWYKLEPIKKEASDE